MKTYTILSDMVITYNVVGEFVPAIVNAPYEFCHPPETPDIVDHEFYFNEELITNIPQKLWEWIQNECNDHFQTEPSEFRLDYDDEINIDFTIEENGCVFKFKDLDVTSKLSIEQFIEIQKQNKEDENENH